MGEHERDPSDPKIHTDLMHDPGARVYDRPKVFPRRSAVENVPSPTQDTRVSALAHKNDAVEYGMRGWYASSNRKTLTARKISCQPVHPTASS
jgi:hypothetical protein